MGLASRAFASLIPLLLVINAYSPLGGGRVRSALIHRMGLDRSAAAALQHLTVSTEVTRNQTTFVGAVIVLVSALSFMRSLQYLYELSWEQPRLGVRGSSWSALGLASIIIYLAVLGALAATLRQLPGSGIILVATTLLASFVFWLWLPYVLLAQRIRLRRLLPTAIVTSLGLAVLSIGSSIYLPHTIVVHSLRYGPIGVIFAILSWFVAFAFVVVAASVGGAIIDEELRSRAANVPQSGLLASSANGDNAASSVHC
jgi:membrane protein